MTHCNNISGDCLDWVDAHKRLPRVAIKGRCNGSCKMQIRYAPVGLLNTCTAVALPVNADKVSLYTNTATASVNRKVAHQIFDQQDS
jgi:hypothetical protein